MFTAILLDKYGKDNLPKPKEKFASKKSQSNQVKEEKSSKVVGV